MVFAAQKLILQRRKKMLGKKSGKKHGSRAATVTPAEEKKTVSAENLRWKTVTIPDTLDDYEGFYGLEEIDGVDVKIEDGKVQFVVKDGQNVKEEGEEETNEEEKAEEEKVEEEKTEEELENGQEEEEKVEESEEEDQVPSEDEEETPSGGLSSNVFNSLTEDQVLNIPDDVSLPAWTDEIPNLSPATLKGLSELGFDSPTLIQEKSISLALEGKDVIGKAITGSGKTLAYGIPILEKAVAKPNSEYPNGVVFCPTRELANQVMKHLQKLFKNSSFPHENSIVSLTGGLSIQKQERLLGYNPRVLIATPGRFLELLEKSTELATKIASTDILVLDEADRLLQDGHFDELGKIIEVLNSHRPRQELDNKKWQSLVFSATFSKDLFGKLDRSKTKPNPTKKRNASQMEDSEAVEAKEVISLLSKQMKFRGTPSFVDVNPTEVVATRITEAMIPCAAKERDLMLYYFLSMFPGVTLVFSNSIDSVKRLAPMLTNLGIPAVSLHSSMIQKQRLRSLERFKANSERAIKEKKSSVLVASDVAARGLDIAGIDHVVHYHLPRTADTYIHRSGRTARAGKEGVSIILCSPNEASGPLRQLRRIVTKKNHIDDLKTLPLDMDVLSQLKERLDLSAKLAESEVNSQVMNKEKSWIEKAADELGIEDLSDLEEDDFLKRDRKRKEGKQLSKQDTKAMRAELKKMINRPIRKSGRRSYIAGGLTNVAELLAKDDGGGGVMGGLQQNALEVLKKKKKKNNDE